MNYKKTILMAIVLVLMLVSSACFYPNLISTDDAIATGVAAGMKAIQDQTATVAAIATYTPYPTYTPEPTYTPQVINPAWYQYLYVYQPSDLAYYGSSSYCDRAAFVSETIYDNTVFNAGDTFVKSWTLHNIGQCTWHSSYRLVFTSGTAMGGASAYALPYDVPPGGTVTLSITLTAPSSYGTYRGNWALENASGYRFANFWVQIYVR